MKKPLLIENEKERMITRRTGLSLVDKGSTRSIEMLSIEAITLEPNGVH